MISKIKYKHLFLYALIRLVIFCIPIVILVLIMNYYPYRSRIEGHYTDRGLGFAILGIVWCGFYFLCITLELIYRMIMKKDYWYFNIIVIILFLIPSVLFFL